jgi:hypothetical protein
MNRRSFLQSCIALAVAPAIVRADSLMRVINRDTLILTELGWQEQLMELLRNGHEALAVAPTQLYVPIMLAEQAERIIGAPIMDHSVKFIGGAGCLAEVNKELEARYGSLAARTARSAEYESLKREASEKERVERQAKIALFKSAKDCGQL